MRKDVSNLADGVNSTARLCQSIEKRHFGWRHGKITPVSGSHECLGSFAGEGTCNNTTDVEGIYQSSDRLAERDPPIEPEIGLMRGDLENGIARRITDGISGSDMLLPEAGDDLGSGSVTIAENAWNFTFGADCLDQFRRK